MKHPFRRKNLSPRLLPYYAVAIVAVVLAKPVPLAFAIGLAVVLAGLLLRVWGVGHLVKNDRLTLTGPYAHVRHPLYAGTLLLGVGFGLMAGPWGMLLLAAFFLPVFFFYYLPYKDRVEGARLERRYGVAYARYREAVPAIVPSVSAWRPDPDSGEMPHRGWSSSRFHDNGELGTIAGVGMGLILLGARLVLTS